MSNNLMQAHTQWATRPANERFQSLESLKEFLDGRRTRSRSIRIDTGKMATVYTDQGVRLTGGVESAEPNNWSFGQLCTWASAPSGFLRDKLNDRPELMTQTLNHCLSKASKEELKWLLIEPKEDIGEEDATLQAITSPTYGRIWDSDVVAAVQRLKERSGGKWHNPLAYAHAGRLGGTTVPSGLYASDRDVFCFMIDGGSYLEGGDGKELNRGFFVTNSEVGSRKFTLTTFLHRGVCGNCIVWGAQDVNALSIRHTKNGPQRFDSEAFPALMSYMNRSVEDDQDILKKANEMLLPLNRVDLDAMLAKVAKFGKKEVDYAIQAARLEEGDCRTVWQLVQGLTAHARTFDFVDSRVDLETRAGKLLNLAK